MFRSRWFRGIISAVAAVGIAAGGGASAAAAQPDTQGVQDIDWYNATFDVPAVGSCPAQSVSFANGAGETPEHIYRFTPGEAITYDDVTGDGVVDALMLMDCGPRNSEYSTSLIAMTTGGDGTAMPLGTVNRADVWSVQPSDFTVWYGDVSVAMTDIHTGETWTEYYRWAASAQAFVRVDGP